MGKRKLLRNLDYASPNPVYVTSNQRSPSRNLERNPEKHPAECHPLVETCPKTHSLMETLLQERYKYVQEPISGALQGTVLKSQ